jgi:hypothetical protein
MHKTNGRQSVRASRPVFDEETVLLLKIEEVGDLFRAPFHSLGRQSRTPLNVTPLFQVPPTLVLLIYPRLSVYIA